MRYELYIHIYVIIFLFEDLLFGRRKQNEKNPNETETPKIPCIGWTFWIYHIG